MCEVKVRNANKVEQLHNEFVNIHNKIISNTSDENGSGIFEFEDNYYSFKPSFKIVFKRQIYLSRPTSVALSTGWLNSNSQD